MSEQLLPLNIIRKAQSEDAKRIIEFYNRVGGETDFLSFGRNEYTQTIKEVERTIESVTNSSGSCMLLLMKNNEIVGIGTIDSSLKPRLRHIGILGIVIRQSHIGKGLGRTLMNELIDRSKANGQTKKISLITRADNTNAIILYESLGFKQEGLFQYDTYDGTQYYDSLSMALFL